MANSAPRDDPLCECCKQRPPVLGLAHLERLQRKTVTRHVFLRDRVPATMLDRHPRLVLTHRLEAHIDMRGLFRRKGALPPAEGKPLARRPNTDAPDLKRPPVGHICDKPPALARLKAQFPIA